MIGQVRRIGQEVLVRVRSGAIAVRVRMRTAEIDRELARGRSPDSDPLTRERALQLVSESTRRKIARGLELALRQADADLSLRTQAPVSREAVREAAPALETLIARLLDGGQVSPQGVARAKVLLSDGAGPLFLRRAGDGLLRAAGSARSALDLGPLVEGDSARRLW